MRSSSAESGACAGSVFSGRAGTSDRWRSEDAMIDGLRLTISGEELRRLFEHRIERHERCVKHWKREQARTPEEQTEDEPVLPEQICGHEGRITEGVPR